MTKRASLAALLLATLLIAAAYASAFLPGGTPPWGPWLMAAGVPLVLVSVMVLGAVRGGEGMGRLAWPFAFVGGILGAGFLLALGLPSDEAAGAALYLGLPLRASIILYGIGLLPIVILPVAYALTFDAMTLNAGDVERVRLAGEAWARGRAAGSASGGAAASPDPTVAAGEGSTPGAGVLR